MTLRSTFITGIAVATLAVLAPVSPAHAVGPAPTPSPTPSPTASSAAPSVAATPSPSAGAAATPAPAPSTTLGSAAVGPDKSCDQRTILCNTPSWFTPGTAGTAAVPLTSPTTSKQKNATQQLAAAPLATDPVASSHQAFFASIASLAIQTQSLYGVPASVTMAQAAVESGWGTSSLTTQYNAYFGIKCTGNYTSPYQGGCHYYQTQEFYNGQYVTITDGFRTYTDTQASFNDHGYFLGVENSRYANCWQTRNSVDFAYCIWNDGYATDPLYFSTLKSLMDGYNLYQYDGSFWIDKKYAEVGGAGLGSATSGAVYDQLGNARETYQNGVIILNQGMGAFVMKGAMLGRYTQLGGELGALGWPTSDALPTATGGQYQLFERGAMLWSTASGAWESMGATRDRYQQLGFENGVLGYPTGPITTTPGGLTFQNYQNGAILSTPSSGTWENYGPIRSRYAQLGFENGVLGAPTGPVTTTPGGLTFQNYAGGAILSTPATGAWENYGAIRTRYSQLGFENGVLGAPTGPITTTPGGLTYQNYAKGAILSTPETGAWENYGPVRTRYAQLGFENGVLGAPIGPVTTTPGGLTFQNYAVGAILSTPATGAWENFGAIRTRYSQLGFENGVLGAPTGPMVNAGNGFWFQNYAGGAILYSAATGAWENYGAIRSTYASLGFERSALGLPTGPITGSPSAQSYEHGTITAYASGAQVSYN